MTPFAIAGIQMHVAALHSNVEEMCHKIDILMARFPWTQMVLFSELAPYGPLDRYAQPFPNEAIEQFRHKAVQHGVWLIPGSMFERTEVGTIRNTAVVINPAGEIVAKYSKMFPFRPTKKASRQGRSSVTSTCLRLGVSACRSATTCGFRRPRAI